MKKSVLIAAGAIAFDLGVMVVAAQAAPSNDWETHEIKVINAPAQASMKYEFVKDGKKVGTVADEKACKTAGGSIDVQSFSWGASQKVCVLPSKTVAK